MLTRDQAQTLTKKILSLSKADEAHVSLSDSDSTNLRFARNTPSTSGTHTNLSISVRSTFGKRSGSVTVNQTDDATLTNAVRRSESLAKLSPEDREHMPGLGAQTYREVDAFSEATAKDGPMRIADGVATCLRDAVSKKVQAAGFTEVSARASAIANSRGLFAYHRSTGAYVAETARTPDGKGSGWASQSSHDVADLDYAAVSAAATRKALASAGAKPLPPGKYVTILEPACVANLVGMMLWSMQARSADEGRSFFSAKGGGNRIGEKLFPEAVNIYSDPNDPKAPATPWSSSGLPLTRRDWVADGVLKNLIYSRYWAAKQGKPPVPRPSNLIMKGGTGSLDDLIKSTKRGLLVTSLWYIRSLDPRTLLYTGLTRDGVFLVENGKVTSPVTNFRWNDSPISVLKNIDAMTAPVRVPPRPQRRSDVIVPALRVKEFNFSSVSDAV